MAQYKQPNLQETLAMPGQGSFGFTAPGIPATAPQNPFENDPRTARTLGEPLSFSRAQGPQPADDVWSSPLGGTFPAPSSSDIAAISDGATRSELDTGVPNMEDFYVPPYEEADWIQPTMDSVRDYFSNVLTDPDWSLWSPEARAAADRRVGSMLAISERDIGAGMAARGLGHSGIRDQLMRDANVRAALGLGDISAQFSEADELARREAARQLEDIRRWSSAEDWNQYVQAAQSVPGYAAAVGDIIRTGPELETLDFEGWLSTAKGWDEFKEALKVAYEAGEINEKDIWGIFLQFAGLFVGG